MKSDLYLTPCIKINSKCIEDLSIRPETTILLEEKTNKQNNQKTQFKNGQMTQMDIFLKKTTPFEKVLNIIINIQENTNQNYSKISPHTC